MKRLYGAVVRTQRKELTIIGMSTRNQLTYCLKYDKHLLKGIKKAEELTRRNFNGLADYEPSRETPFRFGSYTSLGEAYIETGLSEIGMTNYKRALSLDSALAVVSFRKDGVNYERKYFASYPDSVMVIKFTADKPGMQNLVFSYGANPEATGTIKRTEITACFIPDV